MTSGFSSSAEAAIGRTIEINGQETVADTVRNDTDDDIAAIYELDEVARELVQRDLNCIAMQFPDELLHDAVSVYKELKKRLPDNAQLYVLADTSYGSCCVDEVAAQHVDADVVVHFGHACLSRTSRLPVLYVFGRRALDPRHALETLVSFLGRKPAHVKLAYDAAYAYAAEQLYNEASAILPNSRVEWSLPPPRFWLPHSQTAAASAPSAPTSELEEDENEVPTLVETDVVIFYVGAESLSLSTLLMTDARIEAYSYDPTTRTARAESARTNSILARRYALVHRARRADVFGIVVGTLGVASYLPLIAHLRKVLARARKKTYTFSVGKLNPAKLANFTDVGCFVLVACPQTSVVDSRDYFAPVITPFELLLALAPGEPMWTGDYDLDFDRLLSMPLPDPDGQEDDDAPQYDFTTGKLRAARRFGVAEDMKAVEEPEGAVVPISSENALATGVYGVGAGFLRDRQYKGLEVNAGQDAPSILEQGRTGIARGYDTVEDHE